MNDLGMNIDLASGYDCIYLRFPFSEWVDVCVSRILLEHQIKITQLG